MRKMRTVAFLTLLCLILAIPGNIVLAEDNAPETPAAEQESPVEEPAGDETSGGGSDADVPDSNESDAQDDASPFEESPVDEAGEPAAEDVSDDDPAEAVDPEDETPEPDVEGLEMDDSEPGVQESQPAADASGPEDEQSEDVNLPGHDETSSGTEEAEIVAEVIQEANQSDINIVPLDEEGESLPLASNEAADTISSGDPYFQDVSGDWIGYTKLGGTCDAIVSVCNQVATPVQAAVDAAPTGATIYIEKDTYDEDVVINKQLTLAGQWLGNTNLSNRPTINGTVTINAAGAGTWLHGLIINAVGNAFGVVVNADDVTVSNSKIENAGSGIVAASEANIIVNNADNVTIDNNTIQNASDGSGITLNSATNVTITNNIIEANGNTSGGLVEGGILVNNGDGLETIRNNNILDNNIGINNNAGPNAVNAPGNYFSGNDSNTEGGTVNTAPSLASPALLPVAKDGPPAPGGGSVSPPAVDVPELPLPLTDPGDSNWKAPICGSTWDAPRDLPDDGSYERLYDNIWIKYDNEKGGWVHWFGEGSGEFLRDREGRWYSVSDAGVQLPLANINDTNFSVLSGEWCAGGGNTWSVFENCALYVYENGQFKSAMHSSGTLYEYDADQDAWVVVK